jgi:hypothetical protein
MMPIILNVFCALVVTAYVPVKSGVMFTHSSHISERDIECKTCHDMAQSVSLSEKNIPGHDICSQCHSVDKADDCRLCHKNPGDPSGVTWPAQELKFSHKAHLGGDLSNGVCLSCHHKVDKTKGDLTEVNFPAMQQCFRCHDDAKASSDCKTCHSKPAEMKKLMHAPDYRHSHKFDANAKDRKNCRPCHQAETFCSDCHAGDNLTGFVHDLNYRFNHALDAKGKENQCESCHDMQTFCEPCHQQEGNIPLSHLAANWSPRTNPAAHATEAQKDIEACAACHDEPDGTCSQPGCHYDGDGIRGNNPTIHASTITDIGHGPWHDDPGFQCFRCHISTHQPGRGFCGYCHGAKGQ